LPNGKGLADGKKKIKITYKKRSRRVKLVTKVQQTTHTKRAIPTESLTVFPMQKEKQITTTASGG